MNSFDSIRTFNELVRNGIYVSLSGYLSHLGVQESVQKKLLSRSYQVNLERGDVFIPEFDNAAICLVQHGLLRSNVVFFGDEIRNRCFLMKGMTFVGSASRSSGVIELTCLEDTALNVIPGDCIYAEAQQSRAVFDFILWEVQKDQINSRDWLILGSIVGKRDHMLFSLILMAVISDITNTPKLVVRYQDLADMCSTSHTYAVGVVQEAIAAGALEKSYRGITVKDIQLLGNMVELEPLMEWLRSR